MLRSSKPSAENHHLSHGRPTVKHSSGTRGSETAGALSSSVQYFRIERSLLSKPADVVSRLQQIGDTPMQFAKYTIFLSKQQFYDFERPPIGVDYQLSSTSPPTAVISRSLCGSLFRIKLVVERETTAGL